MKSFQKKAVDQILAKKSLTPHEQRRLWGRATTAKKLILEVIAPDLLELRVRVDALEEMLRETNEVLQGRVIVDRDIDYWKDRAREAERENDRLKYLAQTGKEVWAKLESGMQKSVEQVQRKAILKSAGVDDK
jgi:hypothetical protein